MTSVTRPRARSALVCGAALLLLAGAVGCDSGDDIGGDSKDVSTSDQGKDSTPVATVLVSWAASSGAAAPVALVPPTVLPTVLP